MSSNLFHQTSRSLVINGHDAPEGRFPYFANLTACGGAWIAPDVILTAGHCRPRIKSREHIRHPDFECIRPPYEECWNDWQLVILEEPRWDQPLLTLYRENADNLNVTVLGLGNTDRFRLSRASVLQVAALQTISNEKCSQAAGRNLSYAGRIDDDMICTTGGPNNERDAW